MGTAHTRNLPAATRRPHIKPANFGEATNAKAGPVEDKVDGSRFRDVGLFLLFSLPGPS